MSDSTDEGERLGAVLRTRGYAVVDVPTRRLAQRARRVGPSLVLCDLDGSEAQEALVALAEFGQGPIPHVLVFSDRGPAAIATHPALERLRAELFPRPIDVFEVLRRVEALLGAPSDLPGGSLMPPSARSARSSGAPAPSENPRASGGSPAEPRPPSPSSHPETAAPKGATAAPSSPTSVSHPPRPGKAEKSPSAGGAPAARAGSVAIPPPTLVPTSSPTGETLGGTTPRSHRSVASSEELDLQLSVEPDEEGRARPPPSPLSPDLVQLLASAEARMRHLAGASSRPPRRPSAEEDLETLLPAEVLEALDAPLDDEPAGLESREPLAASASDPGWTGASDAEAAETGAETRRPITLAETQAGPGSVAARGADPDDSETPPPKRPSAAQAALDDSEPPAPTPRPPGSRHPDAAQPVTPSGSLAPGRPHETNATAPLSVAAPREAAAQPAATAAVPLGPATGGPVDPTTRPPGLRSTDPPPVTHRPGTQPPASSTPPKLAPVEPPGLQPRPGEPGTQSDANRPSPEAGRTPHSATPSEPPRRPTPPNPILKRQQAEGASRLASLPSLRANPGASGRTVGQPSSPPFRTLAGSVPPPPGLPSNAFLAGGSLAAPRPSSGPPIVSAMPIPAQEVLDEPFGPTIGARVSAVSTAPGIEIPTTLHEGDAVRAVALLVRTRYSGAVAFETAEGVQRAVLRDGDFVTAASGLEAESLVAFLLQRGVLTPDAAANLARRVPGFGRHAGAALIAHGHLRQEELWPVLRAHAEWILGRMLLVDRGAASLEPEIPVRLKSEPAVFGGATGAEVLVEVVRRVVPPELAVRQLGGQDGRFGDGVTPALLGECALPDHEQIHVNRARSAALGEVLSGAKAPDFAAVLYALVELGVLDRRPARAPGSLPTAPPSRPASAEPPPTPAPPTDPARRALPDLPANPPPRTAAKRRPAPPSPSEADAEAARRQRLELHFVTALEGDYFAVLGLPHDATAEEIRRAHGELCAILAPSEALTARDADRYDELTTLLEVVDEALAVLGDDRRRERYLRAIDSPP